MEEVKIIISIYAPVHLVQQAGAMARERGESRSKFMVQAIREAVEGNESPDPDSEAEKKSPKR